MKLTIEQKLKLKLLNEQQRRDRTQCVFLRLEMCRPDWLGVYTHCEDDYIKCDKYLTYVRKFVGERTS